jgi:hypothetical protein
MGDLKSDKPESRGQEQDSKLKLVSSFLELQQKELAVKQDEIAYHQFSKDKDVALAEKALASDETGNEANRSFYQSRETKSMATSDSDFGISCPDNLFG